MNEKYPLALPEGTVLAGQYIVEKVLGQGGFGITYAAKDHKTGERVAVKEFFPDAMATRTNQTTVSPFSGEKGENYAYGKTCFLQEAETLAKFIGNENIVRVHSYFEENGTAYFVMDFIEGTSFDEYLKQRGGKISYEEAAQILMPVMDALSAVHSKGIIHRDVTPDNIYITKQGVVKLLDFGAARYSLGDQSRSLDIILKHGFAPKEQYTRRGKQGPYTDIYALGATFYFALTGKRPPDSVERMDEDDLVPPSALGIQFSDAAEDAILKALSIQPVDRFQNMMAFKAALLNLQQTGAVQPAMVEEGQPTVVQTFFNAPEQSSIPRTGVTGSPTPVPGQDTDLQDLAQSVKTAGRLAGRLAGKMAGKMAEKSAETAGIMAGTAGKMAEIMAAKKAETAEKLAAKMAEREAEKAARAAEEAARREAERVAAEEAADQAAEAAARQASVDTADRTAAGTGEDAVGETVGAVAGSAAGTAVKSAPAKKGVNKKLLIPVAAAAVILIGVFALKLGGGDQAPAPSKNGTTTGHRPSASSQGNMSNPAPDKSAAPDKSTTPDKSTAPDKSSSAKTMPGDFTVVGNQTGNIMNDGLVTVGPNGYMYWISDNHGSVYSEAEQRYLTPNKLIRHYDLSFDSGKLYYRRGYTVYAYNPETKEDEEVPYLTKEYTDMVNRLFLTKDYYVISRKNRDDTVTVCLVSRSDGQTTEVVTLSDENMFTLSNDGWIYYINTSGSKIYRTSFATLTGEGLLESSELRCKFPIVAGDYLYFFAYDGTNKSNYWIFRVDRNTGSQDSIKGWNISTKTNLELVSPDAIGINVNYATQDIFFYLARTDSSNSSLFKIKGYEDGTFDCEQIPENAYVPNILYYTDGSYRVNYLSWDYENPRYRLVYRAYDQNGNQIQN